MIIVAIRTLGDVILKLGEWFQLIPGTTSEISAQNNAVVGTAKILLEPSRSSRRLINSYSSNLI